MQIEIHEQVARAVRHIAGAGRGGRRKRRGWFRGGRIPSFGYAKLAADQRLLVAGGESGGSRRTGYIAGASAGSMVVDGRRSGRVWFLVDLGTTEIWLRDKQRVEKIY